MSREVTEKWFFDADSLEEAEKMIEEIEEGDRLDDDLPNLDAKTKGGGMSFEFVEEVK
jgi:hypothetical protein